MCRLSVIGFLLIWLSIAPGAAQSAQGYGRSVTDQVTTARITSRFQKELAGLGIPATVRSCRLMAAVAVGSANSDIAYGAACRVAIGSKSPREFLLCDDDYGEGFTLVTQSFVDSPDWMIGFVRKNCF